MTESNGQTRKTRSSVCVVTGWMDSATAACDDEASRPRVGLPCFGMTDSSPGRLPACDPATRRFPLPQSTKPAGYLYPSSVLKWHSHHGTAGVTRHPISPLVTD